MTKTTNFEISKKLAEIGFNKETNFYYRKTDKELFINTPPNLKNPEEFFLKSYDLEILLDVLPNQFGQSLLQITMLGNQALIGYELLRIELSSLVDGKNESLADTAGRLIIELHEKNLIKF